MHEGEAFRLCSDGANQFGIVSERAQTVHKRWAGQDVTLGIVGVS